MKDNRLFSKRALVSPVVDAGRIWPVNGQRNCSRSSLFWQRPRQERAEPKMWGEGVREGCEGRVWGEGVRGEGVWGGVRVYRAQEQGGPEGKKHQLERREWSQNWSQATSSNRAYLEVNQDVAAAYGAGVGAQSLLPSLCWKWRGAISHISHSHKNAQQLTRHLIRVFCTQ